MMDQQYLVAILIAVVILVILLYVYYYVPNKYFYGGKRKHQVPKPIKLKPAHPMIKRQMGLETFCN